MSDIQSAVPYSPVEPPSHVRGSARRRTALLALALFLVSLAVRAPALGYPETTVYDEGLNKGFLVHELRGTRYFEIHPPLARVIMRYASQGDESALAYSAPRAHVFTGARAVSLVAGTLVPLMIFLLARLVGASARAAFAAGLFAALDSLLITYSRLYLTDSLLWLFGLAAILAALLGARSQKFKAPLIIASAALTSLAFSVKWTGVGFGLVAAFATIMFGRRNDTLRTARAWGMGAVGALIVHIAVIGVALLPFSGGPIVTEGSPYPLEETDFIYPESRDPLTLASFAVSHMRVSYTLQSETSAASQGWRGVLNPFGWTMGSGDEPIWVAPDGRRIIVFFNRVGLTVSLCALLFLLSRPLLRRNEEPWRTEELFVLGAYAILFGLILIMSLKKQMSLYHHSPAYLIGLLALAVFFDRVSTYNRRLGQVVLALCLIGLIAFFFLQSPFTYGL